jgi:hypothetical protein
MSCPQPASASAHHLPRKHTCNPSPSRSTPAPPAPEHGHQTASGWSVSAAPNRHVITTIGLSRTSAEHLAEHITDVLNPPEETLDVTELIALLEFYARWLNADIDHARARLPLYGAYSVEDLHDDTARLVKTLKAIQIAP